MTEAKKKPARELTTEEVARQLFPKEVREKAKEVAKRSPAAPKKTTSRSRP